MTLLARLINSSMTRILRSVQIANFLNPRLCHELVRSTTQRIPACEGSPLVLIS